MAVLEERRTIRMKWAIIVMLAIFVMNVPAPAAGAADLGRPVQMGAGKRAVEQEIDGVKAVIMVREIREWLKGQPLPKGYKATHHLMVSFMESGSRTALTEGEVRVKVAAPDGTEQTKDLANMQWHFGADFDFSRKGNYGVMVRFRLRDGKVRSTSFYYEVK
jgi:hypothetical protein